jgi:type II secretory pathway component PulC
MTTIGRKSGKGILIGLVLCALTSFVWLRWKGHERHRTVLGREKAVSATAEQPLNTGVLTVPAAASSKPAVVIATQTEPHFQLIGTFIAPPMTPSAVIATAKGETLFTPGAAIDGRWRLQRVFPGRIVVRSAERESILLIQTQFPVTDVPPAATIEAPPTRPQASHVEKLGRYYAGRPPETVAFPGGLQTYGIEAVRDQTFSVDMKALLDQHLQTPLWRQFDYEMDTGGIRLVEIVPGGVVDRFGFVPGDIVAKIDDIPITRIEDLQYLLHPNSHRVRVEFMRASTAMTHTYLLQ